MKLSRIFSFIVCAGLFVISCVSANSHATDKTFYSEYDIIGIDISRYQGAVNFEEIEAAGVNYVFIRATEGITYQDGDYKSNVASARAAGLTIGAYHFYETNDDPDTQLKNFTSLVTLKPGDLPPVVDIEKLHNNDELDLTKNLQKYLNGLESHYGVKPVIYSGFNFSNKYLTGFGDYPLWLADYKVNEPKLPMGWSDWAFWQWSQSGTTEGVNGYVDTDRYNGNEASFRGILIK